MLFVLCWIHLGLVAACQQGGPNWWFGVDGQSIWSPFTLGQGRCAQLRNADDMLIFKRVLIGEGLFSSHSCRYGGLTK